MPNVYKVWTMKEIGFLQRNYQVLGAEKVAKELGRTVGSVYRKAHKVSNPEIKGGIKRQFTKREIQRIKEVYPAGDINSLSREINRSLQSIGKKARDLGLSRPRGLVFRKEVCCEQ